MEQNKELETAKTLGIVSLVCAFIFWPAGIVCGHISLGKYKKLDGVTDGKGLAKAGLIISYIGLALTVIYVIAMVVLVGGVAAAGGFEGLEALENLEIPAE